MKRLIMIPGIILLHVMPPSVDTETPARRDRPRKSITRTTYTVANAGEGMWRITQKLGAAARPHWFGELRDANPHKTVAVDSTGKQLGWAHLDKGETVNEGARLRPDLADERPQLETRVATVLAQNAKLTPEQRRRLRRLRESRPSFEPGMEPGPPR